MVGAEVVSLAGTIVQFTQVGVEFFSRFLALYRSANGTLEEMADKENHIQALLRDIASLEAIPFTQIDNEHVRACRKVLEQLSQTINLTKGHGKRRVISNFKAAARAVRNKQRFEQLDQQLVCAVQNLQLSADVQHARGLESINKQLETLVLLLKTALEVSCSQKPKDMGYPWERGAPEEYVHIDDGLGQSYDLPSDFCCSKKAFLKLLLHKFEVRDLPGLDLVRSAHLELWSWDERTKLDIDTWNLHVTSGRGLKVSFVMSTDTGFDHLKCVRCGKKQVETIYRRRYSTCPQCQLEVRWVEPDEIPYETKDTALIPFNGDVPQGLMSEEPSHQSQSQFKRAVRCNDDAQAIEKVCRRLTMKWEPIFNITHRYLYCRCILRRSTPSPFCPEITALINSRCPRHSSNRTTHADYGDINYHQDPYFDQFGGYNAFRAMVFSVFPGVYMNVLGRYDFIAEEELQGVVEDLNSAADRLGETLEDAVYEYKYDVFKDANQAGISLPSDAIEILRLGEEREQENEIQGSRIPSDLIEDFRKSPMSQEVMNIQLGRWSGKPHWAVGDC